MVDDGTFEDGIVGGELPGDELDPLLEQRFKALADVTVPDTWARISTNAVPRSTDVARTTRRPVIAVVAAAIAMIVGGIALSNFGDDAEQVTAATGTTEPSTDVTARADGDGFDPEARLCSTTLAESLGRGVPTVDYEPSDSPSQLTELSPIILRGQLISARSEAGGTVLDVKVRDAIGDERLDGIGNSVSLWTLAGQPPSGLLAGDFVAFLTGEQMGSEDGTTSNPWVVQIEGLWVACDAAGPAASVIAGPTETGWRSVAEGATLDELWQLVQFPERFISRPLGPPTVIENGAAVFDLRLIDGARFRLSLPERWAEEMTFTQWPAPSSTVIEGPSATIELSFGFCPDPGGMRENRLGSTVAISGTTATVCRPDELLSMAVAAVQPLTESDAEVFDLRPIHLGTQYAGVLSLAWPDLANCSNCARWGPMVFEAENVAVNRTGQTAVTAVDLDTLAEVWSADTGGFGTALHGGSDGVYLEVTGGAFLRLDPTTGREQWRLERDPDERDLGLSGHEANQWFVRSSFAIEGDPRPPILRRIDIDTGEILWTTAGREGTEWQWSQPAVFSDRVILMDVPDGDGIVDATLRAYHVQTGREIWTTDLDSPNAAFDPHVPFDTDGLSVLEFEDGAVLIVRTVGGDILRVDPTNGRILWRREGVFDRVSGTDLAADGSLAVAVDSNRGPLLIDPNTGENKAAPIRPGACPATIPPEPGFEPPLPWNPNPSDPETVWFGSADLWTVLDRAGHTLRKSVWWSANFPGGGEEEMPEVEVIYERLDADDDPVVSAAPGTNAYTAEDGWFMINGIEPDESGCWRATATYKGAELSYVFENR